MLLYHFSCKSLDVSRCGRLLQRQCVAAALGVPFAAVTIQRTKGRKPFFAGRVSKPQAPNFNFNVSHEVRGLENLQAASAGSPAIDAAIEHTHRIVEHDHSQRALRFF